MPIRSSMSSMVTWSRLGYRPPFLPTTRTPRPGPAAQIMPPLLVGGIVGPGMGSPGRGPLRPPRPACFPRKLRANREVSLRTQEGGAERLKLKAEAQKAFAPNQGERQGRPKTSPAHGVAQMALPWLMTFRSCDGCLQEPSQSLPPRSSPPTAPASPT